MVLNERLRPGDRDICCRGFFCSFQPAACDTIVLQSHILLVCAVGYVENSAISIIEKLQKMIIPLPVCLARRWYGPLQYRAGACPWHFFWADSGYGFEKGIKIMVMAVAFLPRSYNAFSVTSGVLLIRCGMQYFHGFRSLLRLIFIHVAVTLLTKL